MEFCKQNATPEKAAMLANLTPVAGNTCKRPSYDFNGQAAGSYGSRCSFRFQALAMQQGFQSSNQHLEEFNLETKWQPLALLILE